MKGEGPFWPEPALVAQRLDDIALAGLVLHDLLERTDPSVVREHWEGDVDVLELVRKVMAVADTMVGGPILRRLEAMAQSFASDS